MVVIFLVPTLFAGLESVGEKGEVQMKPILEARWFFDGELGRRIKLNEQNWILRAVTTNPGMLHMFRTRDDKLPFNEPVPWAGEFAGKYLISAVQACRMSENPAVEEHVKQFVRELIACQAEDGYLGPWRKEERLLGHWDLWGHYHCMLGLLMWYDHAKDEQAFDAAKKIADLVCHIFLDGSRRPVDAGSPMVNLAILHGLGNLYRRTNQGRYLDMMFRIVEDMEKDGDWLRLGEKGVPYYQLPGGGTRWESLHIVQGLVELYRITGEERYKTAVLNLWQSIRAYDRHPSGAFSTNEQAFGTIFAPGSIETCCSVAWEALTIDVLELTGDAAAADELELTTWNQVLAAQHPSASWWTYDTPLNGLRVPSFHHIGWQARPGTPELNCCSVNGPRGLGMLSEWAVMETNDGFTINLYAPMKVNFRRQSGTEICVQQSWEIKGDEMKVGVNLSLNHPDRFTLLLRVPSWSGKSRVNGEDIEGDLKGKYYSIDKEWGLSNHLELSFEMSMRTLCGQDDRYGQVVFYKGPFLLTYDPFFNGNQPVDSLKPFDFERVSFKEAMGSSGVGVSTFAPIVMYNAQVNDNENGVILCDFATAGAHGTEYAAWLPAVNLPPPVSTLIYPKPDEKGKPGKILFSWKPSIVGDYEFELVIARDKDCVADIVEAVRISKNHYLLDGTELEPGAYFWKVSAISERGVTEGKGGGRRFYVDKSSDATFYCSGPDGLLLSASLAGDVGLEYGALDYAKDVESTEGIRGEAAGALYFNGTTSGIRCFIPYFPEDEYTCSIWIYPMDLNRDQLQQVFSAWCAPYNDPLRIFLGRDGLKAGIEYRQGYITPAVPVEEGRWYHVVAVKKGSSLNLYLDGSLKQTIQVPEKVLSSTNSIGLGHNPNYSGGEYFKGKLAQCRFWERALSEEEIVHWAGQ